MSKSNTTETDILAKVFQATELSWDGNANLYVSLHTADPGEGGSQTTSEATYGSYDRVTVARDATGWDVTGSTASNDDLLQFPQASSGSNTITHVAIGTADYPTAGQIIYSGELNSSLSVSNGIQPQFAAGALTTTED
jgi:hypothetical protein